MAHYRESYIFRIETDEPGTVWSGEGDILLPADAVLPEPTLALGGGALVSIPDLDQLINGVAQRAEFVLSGVSAQTMRYAAEEADQVPGAPVYIGRIAFDEDWQPSGPVEWEWSGEGRKLSVEGRDATDRRERTLTLVVGAGDTTRSRSPIAFFTDADQRREFPDDDVFSHVAGLNAGTSRRFGPAQ